MGGYEAARAEARLAEEGTLAMTVMAQSIRDAEPTSLAVSGQTVTFTQWQPGASPTDPPTSSAGYGFAFSGGTLWQITGSGNSAPLALNADGGFSPIGSAVSQVTIALTLSNTMTDTTLSWNRVVAVESSAYVR
jgi:hypothetical protein